MNNLSSLASFQFLAQSHMIAGNGLFRNLPRILREHGYQKPEVLVDEGFSKSLLWKHVVEQLKVEFGPHLRCHVNSGSAEPTYAMLRAKLAEFQGEDRDVIVGVGGGSCMDTAKAIAVLLTNPGDPLIYRGFDQLRNAGVPVLLVPTTAGTGSEASYNASFVDTDGHRKMGINGKFMFAAHAILDGETTLSCPYSAALSAGVDALVHTLEGFVCKQRNPLSHMLAKQAFVFLVKALPSLKRDPKNVDERLKLLLGAYLGGMIQMNAGSGVASAISYPLSVYYKVPHGIGGGMFCIDMIRFNIEAGFYLYAELAPLLGIGRSDASERENALCVWEYLQTLWTELGVPNSLLTFGIRENQFEEVVGRMETQQPGFDQNPVPFTVKDHLPRFLVSFFKESVTETYA